MLNPDRTELGLKPSQVPENPSINRYIPRWFREYAFATRAFLAILTATPAMVVTADAITRIANPSIIYAQSAVNFNLDASLELPGLNTNIDIVKGQQINIEASGRARFYNRPVGDCGGSSETDPDGNRYPKELMCPPVFLLMPSSPTQLTVHS